MREVCGTCKYNSLRYDGQHHEEFCCGNENSDYYSVPTFYDDTCDDWEEKDERSYS